jgi:RNA polymerase sigma factor (sigma-70 family)
MATAHLDTLMRHIKGLAAGRQRTDRQLLDDFASRGDECAFAGLVGRHGPMVLRVCRRVLRHEQDAEDAFQATFLVLARNTASVRKRETLANWLYGVAYRTAMKAKRGAARRRNHEARLQSRRTDLKSVPPTWDDVQAVLDEEVQRLPESFRAAFVLCVLDGKTVPAAAAELGAREGTVSWRLARARQRLRQRLARRGIQLSAVLAALAVARGAAEAAVPAALASSTVRFGLSVAAGEPAAAIPSHVAALAAGVTRAMSLTKAKIATVFVAASLLMAAGGALAYQSFTGGEETPPAAARSSEPPAPKADAAPPAPRADDAGAGATFRGRVLDPDGKPFPGAKLHLIGNLWHRPKPVHVQATSAADGGFRLPVAAADARRLLDEASWATVNVVATAEGYGPAFRTGGPFEPAAQLTLRLVKDDVPVRGRVLDLQGKPLAGVTARVRSLSEPSAGDLSPWLAALEANKQDAYPIEATYLEGILLAGAPEIYPAVTTDADGRFEIKGVGRERLVRLALEGPTVARQELSVYTRPGKPIHATGFARNPEGSQLTYYGATFEHTAAPTRPIVGVVRDKDTGKPLAGVTVQSDRFAGTNTSGDGSVRTVTDKDGRYRLVGMPKGAGNTILAVPAAGQPYLRSAHEVADPLGLEPVTVDFALKRGVLVKGRVTDKATGKPVLANVNYVAFADNPRVAQAPGFVTDHYLQTAEDGSFQLVAFPGRGLLAARGWNDHYRMGVGTDRIEGKFDQRLFNTAPYLQETDTFHTYVELNPDDKAESVTCDLVLDPGTMPHGTLVGPDDKPLAGAEALGLTAYGRSRHWTRAPLKDSAFTVYGLGPMEEREVVFVHAVKQLAGVVRVRGDAKEPLRVKLESWGTVTGRLVGPDGKPRSGLLLRAEDRFLPGTALQTDKDGRFRVAGLAPGVKYTLQVVQNGQPVAAVFDGLALKAAEVRDLGDVVVQPKK